METNQMELLAPAGGPDQLRTAILYGADAVYLASDRFGMRARAANFALDELAQAVAYAHGRDVKVHVTANILMSPDDTDALPEYFAALDAAGVDALIVSDLGAFTLAKRHAPNVELHVSTQASVANAYAANAWYDLGAKRVVLAREASLADIARIRRDTPQDLELEAFVHGAMCMAVSGRCLISSYATGRMANKGACTQPCRWEYRIVEGGREDRAFPVEQDAHGSYILNAKDLCMAPYLDRLAEAGVGSIKIEGRNKKSFYVATVVGAYRRALDGAPADEVMAELEAISHRPYSTGFYFGEPGQVLESGANVCRTRHVGDVLGTVVNPDGSLSLEVLCRNRFDEGEALEILRPGAAPKHIVVANLTWRSGLKEDLALECGQRMGTANRACNVYRLDVDEEIPAGSFLRVRTDSIYEKRGR